MNRRTMLGALGGTVAIGGGYLAYDLFAPEQATARTDDVAEGTVLKRGTFTGKAGHECSGTVELVEDSSGQFLQFKNYQQTQGPAVYCYLTPAEDPDSSSEIDAGQKVPIDGGAEGGEITLTGTFAQRLSATVDPAESNGVAIWCDDFAVPFGAASLSTV